MSSPRSSPRRALNAAAAGNVDTAASRLSAVSPTGARRTAAPRPAQIVLGLFQQRLVGGCRQAERERAGPQRHHRRGRALPGLDPFRRYPGDLLEQQRRLERRSPCRSAAEHDRDLGVEFADGVHPVRAWATLRSRSAGRASQRRLKCRIGRDLRPDGERPRHGATERLCVRQGPLVRHGDEGARGCARAERRVPVRRHGRIGRRCTRRRSPRPGRGIRRTTETTSSASPGRHANAPRASRPLGTATTSGARLASFERGQPQRDRDVVRGTVPAGDDPAHAVPAEQRRDPLQAGRVGERCLDGRRELVQVLPEAGLLRHPPTLLLR